MGTDCTDIDTVLYCSAVVLVQGVVSLHRILSVEWFALMDVVILPVA